ncbi:MAG TPA: hydroxylamine reductase [Kineosporiaceae bacterium]
MFCFQCEQTKRNGVLACVTAPGTCGKTATTSQLQDLLLHAVAGICQWTTPARAAGVTDPAASAFVVRAVFSTLTNVNFSDDRIVELIRRAAVVRDRVRAACPPSAVPGAALDGPAVWRPAADTAGLLRQAGEVALNADEAVVGPDVVGLRALVLYGVKGVCAYAYHAHTLGREDPEVFAGVESALAYLAGGPTDVDELLGRALDVGRLTLDVLGLLDAANTGRFGIPSPRLARTSPVAGKAILVSGHDLGDLEAVLERTRGLGLNVYTHGELLPAHGYPQLAAHPHLVGNYGGAWQDQRREFAAFPGAIVMTSNCLIRPRENYRDRIFTLGPVGWPGVRHLDGSDLSPAIDAALAAPGFTADAPETSVLVGFGADAVLGVAGAVVDAVRSGAIRHFFLVGGCDGAKVGRNYYTEFAERAPRDTVLLTLGCGKYRFNHLDFGEVAGIPRLLDIGQCNDSHSAIRIASALADAFGCGVNDLPLTLVISWFEQKAVAVLLGLLALGLRNISLGPTLPAFLTPRLLDVLVERFGIHGIGDVEQDLHDALSRTS